MTVAVAVRLTPSYVAVMVTDVFVVTLVVVTVKPMAVVPDADRHARRHAGDSRVAARQRHGRATLRCAARQHHECRTCRHPPVTLDGLTVTLCRVGPARRGCDCQRRRSRRPVVRRGDRDRGGRGDRGGRDDERLPVKPLSGTVVVAGTLATAGLLLDSEITAPPAGPMSTSPRCRWTRSPPTTVDGLMSSVDSCRRRRSGLRREAAHRRPRTGDPAEFTPRTRQKWVAVARPVVA